MDNSKILGVENCGKLLWKFSIPAIISMIATARYNIADRIFVGRAVGFYICSNWNDGQCTI